MSLYVQPYVPNYRYSQSQKCLLQFNKNLTSRYIISMFEYNPPNKKAFQPPSQEFIFTIIKSGIKEI